MHKRHQIWIPHEILGQKSVVPMSKVNFSKIDHLRLKYTRGILKCVLMEIVNETVSDLDYNKIDVNYDFSVNCEQFEVSKSSRADVLSSTPRKSNFNV